MKNRVAFLGLGLMGKAMAGRLLAAGYPVVVWNRTRAKADELLARGAVWSESPAAAAAHAEVLCSMVADDAALGAVVLGRQGALAGATEKTIHVDFSTVSPRASASLAKAYGERGAAFLHSPVLGSRQGAADGTLLLFVGGPRAAYDRVKEMLDCFGQRRWYFEEVTQATHMKLAANLLLVSLMGSLVHGLVFAAKAGLSATRLLEVVEASALNAPMLPRKGRTILAHDFEPNFFLAHMLKDIHLILDAAAALAVPLPMLAALRELYVAGQAQGLGEQDYSAVVCVLERMAQVEVGREGSRGRG